MNSVNASMSFTMEWLKKKIICKQKKKKIIKIAIIMDNTFV